MYLNTLFKYKEQQCRVITKLRLKTRSHVTMNSCIVMRILSVPVLVFFLKFEEEDE